jgi:hypothetical protein
MRLRRGGEGSWSLAVLLSIDVGAVALDRLGFRSYIVGTQEPPAGHAAEDPSTGNDLLTHGALISLREI